MVNSKIPKVSIKNPTLPPGLQDSSQHVVESPDSLNLLFRTSSRASKRVHSRGRLQTRYIARRFSKSIFAFSASRNPSPKTLSLSSLGENKEKSVGFDSKTPTVLRVTTNKFSSKRLPSLKLSAAFPTFVPEEKASTMSWDNQVSAEEGRNLVSGPETAPQATQRLQAPMFGLLNMIHESAESASQLGRVCDMTHDSNTLLHTISHSVTCDTMTYNVIYDTNLWNSDHYVTSLSGCDMHLEADAKLLATSLRHFACFIQRHPLKSYPIKQFLSVLGIGSYV